MSYHLTLDVAGKILKAYEFGDSNALTLCHLSKTFDVVYHKQLFSELSGYGINGAVPRAGVPIPPKVDVEFPQIYLDILSEAGVKIF